MESLLSGVWVGVRACVCSILWHVKEIEFHKEIWSLIRLFILMQSSGLNLSVVYDSLRHVLSLPNFPCTPSSTSPSCLHTPQHAHSSSSSSLPNTLHSEKKTPYSAGYQSNSSSLPLLTLAELKLIPVYPCIHHWYLLWKVLQVLWSSLSYLRLQNKTSLWFKTSLWIRRKCWWYAAAADVMDQEDPCQVWFQPAPMVYIGPWSGSKLPLPNMFTVYWFDVSIIQKIYIFCYSVTDWKHCCDKYFMVLHGFLQFL